MSTAVRRRAKGMSGRGSRHWILDYIVTTSGKTAADEVLIKVTGPSQSIAGRSYCLFSSADGVNKGAFPRAADVYHPDRNDQKL